MYTATDHVMVIKRADHTDIPVISTLAHAIWPETYGNIVSAAQIHYMLDLFYSHGSLQKQFDEHHVFLLALMNAETVGFASYSHANKTGTYKIHKLYVHPMLHGKGFGKKLIDRIVHDGKARGATKLTLNVNRENRAVAFYERYGFRIAGNEDLAIGEGYFMNDYVMEKEI